MDSELTYQSCLSDQDVFLGMLESAVVFFGRHVDSINELNVFQTTENRDVYFAHMIYQHHTPKTQEHHWNLMIHQR